jgi:hypothetical protein
MVLPIGAYWYVRDGMLYVLAKGTAAPEAAPLFSSVVGNLIGVPSITSKGCKFKALLDATIRPGRPVYVQSSGLDGAFIAKDVSFRGDNWDNDFYMEVEAHAFGVP